MPKVGSDSFLTFLVTHRYARLWLLVFVFNIVINTFSYFQDSTASAPVNASRLELAQEVCAPPQWSLPASDRAEHLVSFVGTGVGSLSTSVATNFAASVDETWVGTDVSYIFSSFNKYDFETYSASTNNLSRGPPALALLFS